MHNQFALVARTTRDNRWWRWTGWRCGRSCRSPQLRPPMLRPGCRVSSESRASRIDGRGYEIRGVTQARMDAYSTRTEAIRDATPRYVAGWIGRYGRAPNAACSRYPAARHARRCGSKSTNGVGARARRCKEQRQAAPASQSPVQEPGAGFEWRLYTVRVSDAVHQSERRSSFAIRAPECAVRRTPRHSESGVCRPRRQRGRYAAPASSE